MPVYIPKILVAVSVLEDRVNEFEKENSELRIKAFLGPIPMPNESPIIGGQASFEPGFMMVFDVKEKQCLEP